LGNCPLLQEDFAATECQAPPWSGSATAGAAHSMPSASAATETLIAECIFIELLFRTGFGLVGCLVFDVLLDLGTFHPERAQLALG
jgi:hypothetical protein